MRCENKPLLQDDPRFFQDITSTAVEVGLEKEWETRLQNLAKAEAELFRREQQRPTRINGGRTEEN